MEIFLILFAVNLKGKDTLLITMHLGILLRNFNGLFDILKMFLVLYFIH